MPTLELRNDFHNTSTTVRATVTDLGGGELCVFMSDRQFAQVCKRLCGIPKCTCGGVRGPQQHEGQAIALFVATSCKRAWHTIWRPRQQAAV